MFRFTIRDVMWLTVVVAMGVGWWLDHRTVARHNVSLWVHILRKDHALWNISVAIDHPIDSLEAIEEAKKIIAEEDEASRKPAIANSY